MDKDDEYRNELEIYPETHLILTNESVSFSDFTPAVTKSTVIE